jgi:Ca-activated chloride channel family protein
MKERPLVREGSDIVICLDVSTSMLAQDIAPTRLQRAKEQIRGLIYNLDGDRVGLVLFAGEAFVQCPLTLDYGLAVSLLEAAEPDSISVQGTRIGQAIQVAHGIFDRAALGTKSIILVTDGEDQGSKPLEAAEAAAQDGVIIQCVGIGTLGGVPILLPGGSYKEDKQGRKVTSRLDVDTLRKIALATGGQAVITDAAGNMALDKLYDDIKHYERRRLDELQVSLLEDRFQWPLGVALVLLGLELALADTVSARRRRGWAAGILRRVAPVFLVGFLLAFAGHASAAGWDFGNRAARLCQEGNQALQDGDTKAALERYHDAQVDAPDQPVLDYNIGVARAHEEKWDEAREAFRRAQVDSHKDPRLRAKAWYNAGIAEYRLAQTFKEKQALDDAILHAGKSIDANQRALELDPDNPDAQRNLAEARYLLSQLIQQRQIRQKQQQNQPNAAPSPTPTPSENQQQQSSNQQQDQQNQTQGESGRTPTPTPSESDSQQKDQASEEQQQASDQSQEQGGQEKEMDQQAAKAQQARIGEMTKEDAIRLLSTLPDEDTKALEQAFRAPRATTQLEKDW